MAASDIIGSIRSHLMEQSFSCEVLKGREETEIQINYTKASSTDEYHYFPSMHVSGFNDLPAILKFSLGYEYKELHMQKIDQKKELIPIKRTEGIEILLMLDPRVILDIGLGSPDNICETPDHKEMTIRYHIEDFDKYLQNNFKAKLPEQYLKWLIENGQEERWARLILGREPKGYYTLVELIQPDLPPATEQITQKFRYSK